MNFKLKGGAGIIRIVLPSNLISWFVLTIQMSSMQFSNDVNIQEAYRARIELHSVTDDLRMNS